MLIVDSVKPMASKILGGLEICNQMILVITGMTRCVVFKHTQTNIYELFRNSVVTKYNSLFKYPNQNTLWYNWESKSAHISFT